LRQRRGVAHAIKMQQPAVPPGRPSGCSTRAAPRGWRSRRRLPSCAVLFEGIEQARERLVRQREFGDRALQRREPRPASVGDGAPPAGAGLQVAAVGLQVRQPPRCGGRRLRRPGRPRCGRTSRSPPRRRSRAGTARRRRGSFRSARPGVPVVGEALTARLSLDKARGFF
jgi:hypothetical protein